MLFKKKYKVYVKDNLTILEGKAGFRKESIHGIEPGDEVSEIGDDMGFLAFRDELTYVGTIVIKELLYVAFKHKKKHLYTLFATAHDHPELLAANGHAFLASFYVMDGDDIIHKHGDCHRLYVQKALERAKSQAFWENVQ